MAAVQGGCGSPEPYETEAGEATRLDGTTADVESMTVAEALTRRPWRSVHVEGYVLAQPDAAHRLCTRLKEHGGCRGPFLVIDLSRLDLRGKRGRALEHGCCALGAWSPRPVVLYVWLRPGRRALVFG